MDSLIERSSRSSREEVGSSHENKAIGGLWFDWAVVMLGLLFLGGAYLDGWAHNHGRVDESFFTIWHAFFYAGFALVALLLGSALAINRSRGLPWHAALPAGYHLSLLGVLIFAAGGVGDLIWHELFGVEQNLEAVISPSHLMLGLGMGLIVSGPLRVAWQRTEAEITWANLGPALLSLTALISTFTFFMMYSHPLFNNVGGLRHREFAGNVGQMAGVTSSIVISALLVGPVLLAMRRWQLPAGSLTLVWGINTVAMALIGWHHDYTLFLMGAMLLAAVVADLLRSGWRLGPANQRRMRLWAFLAPALLITAFFVAQSFTEGTGWSVHLWTGAVVLSGTAVWLLSYLVFPPAIPAEEPLQRL
jgi:hypothetical protein